MGSYCVQVAINGIACGKKKKPLQEIMKGQKVEISFETNMTRLTVEITGKMS